eukprot:6461398-Amphidinium_carterae.1
MSVLSVSSLRAVSGAWQLPQWPDPGAIHSFATQAWRDWAAHVCMPARAMFRGLACLSQRLRHVGTPSPPPAWVSLELPLRAVCCLGSCLKPLYGGVLREESGSQRDEFTGNDPTNSRGRVKRGMANRLSGRGGVSSCLQDSAARRGTDVPATCLVGDDKD